MRTLLAADEIIELGRPELGQAPAQAIRGVVDAWLAQLSRRLTAILALEDRLAQKPQGAFRAWARSVAGEMPAILELAGPGEAWEIVRRAAWRLLEQAQALERRFGAYLSPQQVQILSMEMDRALDAAARAKRVSTGLRKGLRPSADGLVHAVGRDLKGALGDLGRIVGTPGLGAAYPTPSPAAPTPAPASPGVVGWISDHWVGVLLGAAGVTTTVLVLPSLLRSLR